MSKVTSQLSQTRRSCSRSRVSRLSRPRDHRPPPRRASAPSRTSREIAQVLGGVTLPAEATERLDFDPAEDTAPEAPGAEVLRRAAGSCSGPAVLRYCIVTPGPGEKLLLTYAVRRVVWLVPTLLAMALVTFLVMHATPGSPLDPVAEGANPLSPEAQKNLAEHYGLDKPLYEQFLIFVGNAASRRLRQLLRLQDPERARDHRRDVSRSRCSWAPWPWPWPWPAASRWASWPPSTRIAPGTTSR